MNDHEERLIRDRRLRALADLNATVIWIADADGRVHQSLPSWESFTGQAFEAHRGSGWLAAVHADDRERARATWAAAVRDRQALSMRYRLRRRDGEYREMQVEGHPVQEDGAVVEWVGIAVDVTERLRTEAALRTSEARLRFLDRLGQATRTLVDADEVMAATTRLLGEHLRTTRCAYADVEIDNDRFTIRADWSVPGVPSSRGHYSLDLFGPLAAGSLRQGRSVAVNDVDAELGEEGGARMFNAIGIKAVVCAALVKGQRLVALMAVHQDTPRRWTADELALIEDVVERCWVHIERVRDAAMLREQDRRKDDFIATLAHELRNPLAPVKYAVALMRKPNLDAARLAQSRDIIDRQVSQMARLIDDLLDVSRINRGLVELQRRPQALQPLLRQAAEAARPEMEAAHHHFAIDLPDAPLWLDVDGARLVQVVGNLLTNAAKYTPDGGHVRLAARADGEDAVVEVADDGLGLPPAGLGRLFQPFTQLDHTVGRGKGGLGIGLSLVRSLVELHGGRVGAASPGVGQGSTFTVRLPLLAEAAAADDAPTASMAMPLDGAPTGLRVLVVEDNVDGRRSLVSLLEQAGHETAAAGDGDTALTLARSFGPQVVLLDLGLPGIDGLTVARALRRDPPAPLRALIALTGWGTARDRARTTEAGFDAHLTKPVEPKLLLRLLGDVAAAAT
ncbi:ATP-binding protein [Aquabacterium sp. J223]|uniref:hybrid sensor histidine kinase/response regulator n=1 Tax=Aquabacterium sp. J223 TaxID=2898431 RepID=UPI0021AD7F13|nr:ATP-binding protein [Aquabacterium sp. J223]UUX94739.1 ATP-binding protein [Aquabacterium sp. J223]